MRKSKLLWIMYLVLIVFSTAVSANNITYNYVFNGSSWVPWLATADGRPKVDLNLVNITAGSIAVSENASIVGNISLGDKIVFAYGESIDNIKDGIITVSGNLNVTGDTYLNSMIFEQGNITASHGIFDTLNVTGTGYLNTMSFESGNVTAGYFIGDGSLLSGISNNSINYGWNGSELVPFKLSSDGILQMSINNDIADGLGCTDCIGETEILDVYVLNSGDIIEGNLFVVGNLNASSLNVSGIIKTTTLNVTGSSYLGSMILQGGNITAALGTFTTLNVTGTSYLGSMTLGGGNITASLGTFATLNVTGAAYLGNVTIESGNITPVANNTYSLGSPTLWWKDLYLANDSLYIAGTALSASASGVLQWNGTAISNVAVQTGNSIVLGDSAGEMVGIGTSTPSHKLEVAGAMNVSDLNVSNNLRVAGDLTVVGTSNLGSIIISADNITVNNIVSKDGNISFYNSSGSEKIRILDNGTIGIGTTAPTATLHVIGDGRFSGLLYSNGADYAEYFAAGEEISAGSLVEIRNDGLVYKAEGKGIFAGIASDNAALVGNDGLASENKVIVGLIGQLEVRTSEHLSFGDYISYDKENAGLAKKAENKEQKIARVIKVLDKNRVVVLLK